MAGHRPLKTKLKKALVSLTLAFGCVAGAGPAFAQNSNAPVSQPTPQPAYQAGSMEGLWKVGYVDIVVEFKKCAAKPVCASLYWVNPADKKIFETFAEPRDIRNKLGGDPYEQDTPITQKDVMALCGFNPKIDIASMTPDMWKGSVMARGLNMSADVEMSKVSDDEVKVVGSKTILFKFKHTENWQRVQPGDARYPACRKPGK